jgi:hypothetical protein
MNARVYGGMDTPKRRNNKGHRLVALFMLPGQDSNLQPCG